MRKLFAGILVLIGIFGLASAVQAAPSLAFDNVSTIEWSETGVADTATTYTYGISENIVMRGAPFQITYLVPETTTTATTALTLIIEDYDTGARQTATLTGTLTNGSVNAAQLDVTGKIFDGRVILRLYTTFEEAKRFFIKVHYGN